MHTAIVWLRLDLRLADNPALHHALQHAERIIPVYIHAPEEAAPWSDGGASRWWLHHSLRALAGDLRHLGSRLVLRCEPSLSALLDLVRNSGATSVYWNRLHEPAFTRRDNEVQAALRAAGVDVHRYNGSLLHQPGAILTKTGRPYRVFTPFWRACQQSPTGPQPLPSPNALPPVPAHLKSLELDELSLLPRLPWDQGLRATCEPGEQQANMRLHAYCQTSLPTYPASRDYPDRPGTSHLSPHLHFGEISPQQVLWVLRDYAEHAAGGLTAASESLIRQVGWREFAAHVLHHYPHTPEQPLDERYRNFPWDNDKSLLTAWTRGETGIPIIDAGMRQLWYSGWMHNRVRMLVASFLVKNGGIHWLEGARWFWDTLVDADLANNTLNWQWVAGCGADAAPYFRIFNPVLQSKKFDPDGVYIRRWVPELAHLSARHLHQPWGAPQRLLHDSGLQLGRDYPYPIIDLGSSRNQTLVRFRAHLSPDR